MQRYKTYEPTQSVFISFSPETYFPVGSFERFLVDVFGKVNFEEYEEGTQIEFDRGNEAPYDPLVLYLGPPTSNFHHPLKDRQSPGVLPDHHPL
jgi:hypothetical protein